MSETYDKKRTEFINKVHKLSKEAKDCEVAIEDLQDALVSIEQELCAVLDDGQEFFDDNE